MKRLIGMDLSEDISKGIDRFLRKASWNFLLEISVRALPIDPFRIAEIKGWEVYTYKRLSRRINKTVEFIKRNYQNEGFVFWSKSEKKFVICYDDDIPFPTARWTLLHEMAHIALGHVSQTEPKLTRTRGVKNKLIELEAEGFARRVLCPSIVLHDCGAIEPDEIMNLCGISYQASKHRSDHIKKLENRNMWRTDYLEVLVEKQFSDFINNYLRKKKSAGYYTYNLIRVE